MRDELEEQFQEFVRARWSRLVRTAYLLTGDPHHAEDLTQTALAKAYRSWRRVSRADSPEAYVRRMLVTCNSDRFRKRRVWESLTSAPPETPSLDHHTPDDRSALLTALAELPPRQRAVVVLRYWEDLSESEVADILGCSPGTVKSQASKGLAKLRTHPELARTPGGGSHGGGPSRGASGPRGEGGGAAGGGSAEAGPVTPGGVSVAGAAWGAEVGGGASRAGVGSGAEGGRSASVTGVGAAAGTGAVVLPSVVGGVSAQRARADEVSVGGTGVLLAPAPGEDGVPSAVGRPGDSNSGLGRSGSAAVASSTTTQAPASGHDALSSSASVRSPALGPAAPSVPGSRPPAPAPPLGTAPSPGQACSTALSSTPAFTSTPAPPSGSGPRHTPRRTPPPPGGISAHPRGATSAPPTSTPTDPKGPSDEW